MGEIVQVDFGKRDADPVEETKQNQLRGQAVCTACQHEWEAIAPVGVTSRLECPACALPRGSFRYDAGLKKGSVLFACGCGSEQFYIISPGDESAGRLFKINTTRSKANQLLRVCASCGKETRLSKQ